MFKTEYGKIITLVLSLCLVVNMGVLGFADEMDILPFEELTLNNISYSVSFGKSEVESREKFNFEFDFNSIGETTIKSGTAIDIEFPRLDDITYSIESLARSGDLFDGEGRDLGRFELNNTGIRLIFDGEDIEDVYEVSGGLKFEMSIHNKSNEDVEITMPEEGGNTITVKPETGGSGGIGQTTPIRKTHRLSDNEDRKNSGDVTWWVIVDGENYRYPDNNSFISIKDMVEENHYIVEESFYIYYSQGGDTNTNQSGIDQIKEKVKFEKNSEGKIIGFSLDLNSSDIDYKTLTITYDTVIDEDYLREQIKNNEDINLTNKVEGSYRHNDNGETKDGTINIEETFTSSFSAYIKSKLKARSVLLLKIDAESEEKLPEVKFELYKKIDDSEDQLIGNYETDSQGLITVEELETGDYYFKETKGLDGYKELEEAIEFTIESNTDLIELTVENEKEDTPGEEDEDTPGEEDEDTPGEEDEDTPGEEDEETPGEEDGDTPVEEDEDTPGEEDEDTPGEEDEDTPGEEDDKEDEDEEEKETSKKPGRRPGRRPNKPKEDPKEEPKEEVKEEPREEPEVDEELELELDLPEEIVGAGTNKEVIIEGENDLMANNEPKEVEINVSKPTEEDLELSLDLDIDQLPQTGEAYPIKTYLFGLALIILGFVLKRQ